MGLMSFIKEAGEKLFGKGEAQAAAKAAEPDPNQTVAANQAASEAIVVYIRKMNLDAEGLGAMRSVDIDHYNNSADYAIDLAAVRAAMKPRV